MKKKSALELKFDELNFFEKITNCMYILEENYGTLEKPMYKVYTFSCKYAYRPGCYCLFGLNGSRQSLEQGNYKIYVCHKETAKSFGYKAINKFDRFYRSFNSITTRIKSGLYDITDMAEYLSNTYTYPDFTLVKYRNGNSFIKVSDTEFDECIRLLERNNYRNFRIVKVQSTEQKKCMEFYESSINKLHSAVLDDNLYKFEEYVNVVRVAGEYNKQPKNGFLIFVKNGNVDRFMLMYHTTAKLDFSSEISAIKNCQTYNSFLHKVCKKQGFTINKIAAFSNYCGGVNDEAYTKLSAKLAIQISYITDYECTDILSHSDAETVQVLDFTKFLIKH